MTEGDTAEDLAARNWFGYGRWNAPYWFVGMEPGGVDERASCKKWVQLGGTELIDCRQHHLASNCLDWHDGDRPRTQATWRRLIQLLLGFKELAADLNAVSMYQRDLWGNLSGETASLNLSALHAKNLGTQVNRIAHREERISKFRDRLDQNQPKFVVFYGTGYLREYEKIIRTQFSGAGYAWRSSTLCVLVRHPTGQSNPLEMKRGEWWIRKGQEIKSLINNHPENSLPTTLTDFKIDGKSNRAQVPVLLSSTTSNNQIPAAQNKSIRDRRLAELKSRWLDLDIAHQFNQVHHFASNKFSGKRETLDGFIAWCDDREIRAENEQTLKRALDVACRVKEGEDFDKALKQAWIAHPIATR